MLTATGSLPGIHFDYTWTIDPAVPDNPVLDTSDPPLDTPFNVNTDGPVGLTWTLETGAENHSYAWVLDTNEETDAPTTSMGTSPVAELTSGMFGAGDGDYHLHLRTNSATDGSGVWSTTAHFSLWALDTTPPAAALVQAPADPNNDPSQTLNVVSSGTAREAVTHYKYELNDGGLSAATTVNTAISLSGLVPGTYTLDLYGKDSAGNWQSTPTTYAWDVDRSPPTLDTTLSTSPAAGSYFNAASATPYTVTATDNDPGSDAYGIEGYATLVSQSSDPFATSLGWAVEGRYLPGTFEVPQTEGEHYFLVRAFDVAENVQSTAYGPWIVDTLAPTVTVSITDASLSDSDDVSSVTFQFSEDVLDFTEDDLTLSNGQISGFGPARGDSWTATFTADDGVDGTGSVSVDAGSYTDTAGNTGATGTDSAAIDTANPAVAVTLDDSALKSGDAATVTFDFSEEPTGFTVEDITAGSGVISGLQVDGGNDTLYTATLTPAGDTEDATNTVDVGTGYTDAVGNTGTAGSSANYTVDTLAPTVTVNIVDTELDDGDNASEVTFDFSEDVSGFAAEDLTVSNGAASNFAPARGDSWTAIFTADDGVDGIGSVTVDAGSYTDTAGNAGATGSDSVAIDTANPAVAVTLDDSALKSGDTATVTFDFSETPADFTLEDTTAGSGEISGLQVDGDDDTLYTATLTPADDTEDATNTVDVGTGYTDAAGNTGTAGSSANYTVDTVVPRIVGVEWISPTALRVVFSQNVRNAAVIGNYSFDDPGLSVLQADIEVPDTEFLLSTSRQTGPVTHTMSVDGVFDPSGNPVTNSADFTATFVELQLDEGWNLFGVPIETDQTISEIFDSAAGRASVKVGPVFYWDAGSYVQLDDQVAPIPGVGYWVFCSSDVYSADMTVIGNALADGLISVSTGWNLISPAGVCDMPFAGILDPAWGWDSGNQVYLAILAADQIQPGKGYWLFVPGTGFLLDTSGNR